MIYDSSKRLLHTVGGTKFPILGVNVLFGLTYKDVISHISELLTAAGNFYICTTNSEFIVDAQKDNSFKDIINAAALSLPDGIGPVFAKYYLSRVLAYDSRSWLYPIRCFFAFFQTILETLFSSKISHQKLAGVDLMESLLQYANVNSCTVAFLGGQYKDVSGKIHYDIDVTAHLVSALKKRYPTLRIVYANSQFTPRDVDDMATITAIKGDMVRHSVTKIDFLFVAYGHIKQEIWIARNAHKIPAKISVGVGGSFDFLSGLKPRAPKILIGKFEWLYRLLVEPWRYRRIFKAVVSFPLKVFLYSLKRY